MAINYKKIDKLYKMFSQLSPEEQSAFSQKLPQPRPISPKEKFIQKLQAAGLLMPLPEGLQSYISNANGLEEDRLVQVKGKPVSETILEDRR